MIDTIEMGKTYFELNDTIDTHDSLIEFFKDLGFELIENKSLGNEMFNRVSRFTDNNGLTFDVIWFKNLAHLRFGEWKNNFVEFYFTKIIGSYLPYCDHNTLDFLDEDKRTFKLAITINR